MPDPTQLDQTYDFVLRTFIRRGQAPHFTEIGRVFGVSPDEGRRLLHELIGAGQPTWLFPSTDLIASFAPFNNLPTQYRLGVNSENKWFAQCGSSRSRRAGCSPGRRSPWRLRVSIAASRSASPCEMEWSSAKSLAGSASTLTSQRMSGGPTSHSREAV